MSAPLLAAQDVSRRFGYRKIFSNVTLTLEPGEVLALVGPNGAGKTTLLRVLAGLLKPTTGSVRRNGMIGLVAHHSMGYDALTARENLAFAERLWGVSETDRIDRLLDRLGLSKWSEMRIAAFSRGMIQRFAIARALVHDPGILLLDFDFGLEFPDAGLPLQAGQPHLVGLAVDPLAVNQFLPFVLLQLLGPLPRQVVLLP